MEYIQKTKVKKYILHFQNIPFDQYDTEFNIYFDGNDSVLCDFESALKKQILKTGKEWCLVHGIPYKIENPPNKSWDG